MPNLLKALSVTLLLTLTSSQTLADQISWGQRKKTRFSLENQFAQTVIWEKGPFEIQEVTDSESSASQLVLGNKFKNPIKNQKITINGIIPSGSFRLIPVQSDRLSTSEVDTNSVDWSRLAGSYQPVSGDSAIRAELFLQDSPTQAFQIRTSSASGELVETEFNVEYQKESATWFFDERLQMGAVLGSLDTRRAQSNSTQTLVTGSEYELTGSFSVHRAQHRNSPSLQLFLEGTLGILFKTSGLTYPLYLGGQAQFRYLNLLGSARRAGSYSLSPWIGVSVQSLPLASATLSEGASLLSAFEVKKLDLTWVSLGFLYRLEKITRFWELNPYASYTARGRSSYSVRNGNFDQYGYKFGVRILTSLLRKGLIGVEGSLMRLQGDSEVSSKTGTVFVGYEF